MTHYIQPYPFRRIARRWMSANGAVTITAPATIKVKANSFASFNVQVYVDITKLPVWNLNGGSRGGEVFVCRALNSMAMLTSQMPLITSM